MMYNMILISRHKEREEEDYILIPDLFMNLLRHSYRHKF